MGQYLKVRAGIVLFQKEEHYWRVAKQQLLVLINHSGRKTPMRNYMQKIMEREKKELTLRNDQ